MVSNMVHKRRQFLPCLNYWVILVLNPSSYFASPVRRLFLWRRFFAWLELYRWWVCLLTFYTGAAYVQLVCLLHCVTHVVLRVKDWLVVVYLRGRGSFGACLHRRWPLFLLARAGLLLKVRILLLNWLSYHVIQVSGTAPQRYLVWQWIRHLMACLVLVMDPWL